MIKILEKILESTLIFTKKNKVLSVIYPLVEAADSFFFGQKQITKEAPYIRDSISLKRFMITVVFALLPATVAAIYFFGLRVLILIAISYIFGLATEIIFCVIKKENINEGAFVTCLIFPLILPPTLPYWMAAVGIVVGIFLGKEVFGGTGKNIFNPAMVGRIFLAIAFPVEMTSSWVKPFSGFFNGIVTYAPDTITSATPLMLFKTSHILTDLKNVLFGGIAGCVGETSAILLIFGGIYLVFTKVANWRIPVAYLGSFIFFAFLGHYFKPNIFAPLWFQLFSGGVLFGAFFMATDPVTAPFTKPGKWIFGILLGALTILIRVFSGYVEGVMFAIIFMNTFSPLIDEYILLRKYPSTGKPINL